MEFDFEALQKELEDKILNQVKADLDSTWDQLQPQVVDGLKDCAKMFSKLTIRKLKNEDVGNLEDHIKAQVASLKVMGMSIVAENFSKSVKKVLETSAEIFAVFIAKLVKSVLPLP